MRRFAFVLFAALAFTAPLGGCAQFQKTWDVVTTAKVSPTAVIVAVNSFNALQVTAANYLSLPPCRVGGTVVCRDVRATVPIKNAILSGRRARNALETFLAQHPGELGPTGLYDALVQSTNVLQAIYTQYGVK